MQGSAGFGPARFDWVGPGWTWLGSDGLGWERIVLFFFIYLL